MKRIKGKNTAPEMIVRKLLHSLGYRYRLYVKNLPGKPDLVFPGRKKIIFVNGCFWHGHGCVKGQLPKSRLEFWGEKISSNISRDQKNQADLKESGWEILIVWQCELKNINSVMHKMVTFLDK